jgi:hypothetical protein
MTSQDASGRNYPESRNRAGLRILGPAAIIAFLQVRWRFSILGAGGGEIGRVMSTQGLGGFVCVLRHGAGWDVETYVVHGSV